MEPHDNSNEYHVNAETKADCLRRQSNRALGRVSESNRAFAYEALVDREKRGIRPSSNYSFLLSLKRLDGFLNGKPFKEITADDLRDYLASMRGAGGKSDATVKLRAIHAQTIIKRVLDVDDTRDLPREVRKALQVPRPKMNVRGAIVPDAAFLAAIEAVPRLPYTCLAYATDLIRGLLWVLWDAGFRKSELLSLRVSDVTPHPETGTAKLSLREELTVSHGLKTGARYVIIRDAWPALRAWMAQHPARLDPEAPLFTSLAYYRHVRGLNEDSLNRVVREAFALVGAKPVGSRRCFSAHDFRHTAATRDADNGAPDSYLRHKYGWSGTSPMPAWYVHRSQEGMRRRVLSMPTPGTHSQAPMGAADLGAAIGQHVAAAVAAALRSGQGDAAPAPLIAGGPPPTGAAPTVAA